MNTFSSMCPSDNRKIGNPSSRWLGVSVIAFVLVVTGVVADAQQPKKAPRIGYLSSFGVARESARSKAIRLALGELGYVEGQNIAVEYRYAEGKRDRFPELAAELVHLKVDIILVSTGRLTQAAKDATKTIPIVMIGLPADPIELGFVASLARPGGNITGITTLSRELGGKRLELLKEAVPKVSRIAVVYEPATPAAVLEVQEILSEAARGLGLTVRSWQVRAADGFEKVFAAINKERPDGIYVTSGPLMVANRKQLANLAAKSRLPSVYPRKEDVEAGGLIYYGADEVDIYRRVAIYVDRILKGAKPADLPVEQPTKFELMINLTTAKQIGVTIPQSMLYRADKVIN
jgi:putative tryptophan/tyrosine transport system substrate-binding protein